MRIIITIKRDFEKLMDEFGAWVEIRNEERGIKKRLRIVGYNELIGNPDYIFMDLPIAKRASK
jgi:transcription elongation GreA/GreB family factor